MFDGSTMGFTDIMLRLTLTTIALLMLVGICDSFSPIQSKVLLRRPISPLFATVSITTPSPDDAADMGIREWPQQTKNAGSWSETVDDGESLVRYVLDGTGSVSIDGQVNSVGPGSLIEVTGQATLDWTGKEAMIILTPGYEQTGLLVGVAALLVILTVVGATVLG